MITFPHEDKPPEFAPHYVMGLEHRKTVLAALPPGGRMLEWGSGDSTTWFRANMRQDQELISIENDVSWAIRTGARCHGGPAGANATIGEEAITPQTFEYVWYGPWIEAREGQDSDPKFGYDVILVDGVWRTACLLAAPIMLKHEGVVFLHDAERDWYSTGTMMYPRRIEHGDCPDYAGRELLELRFR